MADAAPPSTTTMAEVETALRAWCIAHPQATLTEIEVALDTRLRVARADLLAEVAGTLAETELRCAECGQPLVRRGDRHRTLRTHGDHLLPLTRSYATCPVCGTGLFPPR